MPFINSKTNKSLVAAVGSLCSLVGIDEVQLEKDTIITSRSSYDLKN